MGPYRESEVVVELHCPRCRRLLPPLEVAACSAGCGTWVSAFAATEVLTDDDRRADPVTRWWKKREPCPICSEQMTLRGHGDPGFLQGCDGHGFWLDAEAIPHTGLGRGVDQERLARKRDDEVRVAADHAARELAEDDREQRKRDKELREAQVAEAIIVPPLPSFDAGFDARPGPAPSHSLHSLAQRIAELEHRNALLEQRIAKLERVTPEPPAWPKR